MPTELQPATIAAAILAVSTAILAARALLAPRPVPVPVRASRRPFRR